MVNVYARVRGGIETISESTSTTEELKQVATEVKELGTVDASFSRGQLYLLEDELVFAQSINESTVGNFLDNVFSKGPINPLQTLGIYKPYETSLEDADQYDGTWRLPYSEIEAVSLLSKGNGYEIFLRPAGDNEHLYRIRNDEGNDYIGFRWLYSPNHDTAVQIASELYDQAMRYGGVEEFNPGGHFPGRTKRVDFNIGESEYAEKDVIEQPTSSNETKSSNKPENESEAEDANSYSDTPQNKNNGQNLSDNKKSSEKTSVEQSSQLKTAEHAPETESINDSTENSTSTQTSTQSDTSTTSKRRWSILFVGIVLSATPPVVFPLIYGRLYFNYNWLILILGSVGIIGILTIIFGIYRIIRY